MKTSSLTGHLVIATLALGCLCGTARAQFNSGSDGSDGAFNPTTNVVIDMADHPTGIYRYSSVNIPTNVNVTFIPNANNTPVVWLVQSNCIVNGKVDVSGKSANGGDVGGIGGPGGYAGGNGGTNPSPGLGPGGGLNANNGSYNYGNQFLVPLLGGSGGGGAADYINHSWNYYFYGGAGGGGGALLIASSSSIQLNGQFLANGGSGNSAYFLEAGNFNSGSGSGGGIRLATTQVIGNGSISAARIRIDSIDYRFGGSTGGVFTKGYQPIIIPAAGQGAQLAVVSVAGTAISASPSGQIAIPDAVISGQQTTPVAIVVQCSNIPLNTPVTVTVQPVGGTAVTATGYNNSGTQASSTATVQMTIPRGGGLISATAVTAN